MKKKKWKIMNLPNSIHMNNKFQKKYLQESTMIGLSIELI